MFFGKELLARRPKLQECRLPCLHTLQLLLHATFQSPQLPLPGWSLAWCQTLQSCRPLNSIWCFVRLFQSLIQHSARVVCRQAACLHLLRTFYLGLVLLLPGILQQCYSRHSPSLPPPLTQTGSPHYPGTWSNLVWHIYHSMETKGCKRKDDPKKKSVVDPLSDPKHPDLPAGPPPTTLSDILRTEDWCLVFYTFIKECLIEGG